MTTALLMAAGVVYVLVRRFVGEPVIAKDVFVVPLVLAGIGVHDLTTVGHWNAVDVVILVLGVVVGLGFGAWRGTSTTLEPRHGVLHQRYTRRTLGIWLVSLAAGGALTLTGRILGMHEETRPVMLSIGLGMLGEAVTLGARALATGLPFAPSPDGRGASPQPAGPTPDAAARQACDRSPAHSPTFTEAVRRLRDDAAGHHRWRG
ncbi:DUF1453 domain-containing protein [Streptomyces tubbatahanensis]|uniref:DUF1453 domain-containing protein n=1 Tax=Streptomyces tubbatahanensis TaxID=2923272 RepID=A0ABY3Y1Q5_9ACTN|nr:DUF1453 domain-containing protein [Streptomyces tubbatahanensis]UNT00768.1 DUF1453 domain-containing protein [Streptomyces tubbatahanensis]